MLKLRDTRSRELADVLPAGRRHLRILVSAPGHVRAYLTADLLRRAAETARLLPTVTDLVTAGSSGLEPRADSLRARVADLNIHPPQDTLAAPVDPLAGVPLFDVGIGRAEEAANSDVSRLARLWILVAPDGKAADPGDDPLAVRLALLRHRYGEPAGDQGATAGDRETLKRWRGLVATWAHSPSGAMSRRHADAVADAFANDLDTTAALDALGDLAEDPAVTDGVKFETFASADRLLGLDLAREIGR
jgi:hypothetical protein